MSVDPGQQLSEHFRLSEFLVSQTAARRGIDMTPPPEVIEALRALAVKVLEPLRVHFGKPVVISSGYRPARLNLLIGGSASSQHCKGEAADFRIPGFSNLAVCQWLEGKLNYDQLIYEYGEAGWVHVSWRTPYRNQELSAVRDAQGQTRYLPGIRP